MKKLFSVILFSIVCLFLSSCDGDVLIKLYIQDLIDTIQNKSDQPVYIKATITTTNIDDDKKVQFIKSNFNTVTNEHKVEEQYSSDKYSFDILIPIIGPNSNISKIKNNDLLYILITPNQNKFNISYQFNKSFIQVINEWTTNEYMQSFNTDSIQVLFNLINDTKNDFTFSASSIYINEKAYPFQYTGKLSRRDELIIRPSEVLIKAINSDNNPFAFITF